MERHLHEVGMRKIRYAAVTTLDNGIKSFMLPMFMQMDSSRYEIAFICNMSDEFKSTYQGEFECIHVEMKRGLHLGSTIKCIWKLYKLFRDRKYDVIEYGTENASFCASIAAAFAGIPVRIYDHWGARFVGYTGVSRFVSKMIEGMAAFFSTDVRQVSFRNMEMCIAEHLYPRKKVKVLGKGGTVGVDFSRFDIEKKEQYRREVCEKYQIPSDNTVFGFVGRIQTDKGVNELIDAFKELSEEEPNLRLMLVGQLEEVNEIDAKKLAWAKESDKVIFTGRVNDPYKYMSAFDIMAHPTYREGFGMVLQEAAALKIPIITTDIIGPGEFIKDKETGILVPAKDSRSLYDAMKTLLYDQEYRKKLAEQCFQYTQQYFEQSIMVTRAIVDREDILRRKKIL